MSRVFLIEIPEAVTLADAEVIKLLKETIETKCEITLTEEQVIRADI